MDDLKDTLLAGGACIVGFADLGVLPEAPRRGLPRGVALAAELNPRIVASISGGPTAEYFAEYTRVNELLNGLTRQAADFLRARGCQAVHQPATVEQLDRDTLSTPLPHKTVATRAGLGWIGKCALLVTESHGSAIRIASVLTDAPLPVGKPVEESRCGDCQECVKACPGQAPTGRHWHAGLARPDFFDAFACHRTAKSLCAGLGITGTVCGICIAACPWTKKYLQRSGCAG